MINEELGVHNGRTYVKYRDELAFRSLVVSAIVDDYRLHGDVDEKRVAQKLAPDAKVRVSVSLGVWQVIREEINSYLS